MNRGQTGQSVNSRGLKTLPRRCPGCRDSRSARATSPDLEAHRPWLEEEGPATGPCHWDKVSEKRLVWGAGDCIYCLDWANRNHMHNLVEDNGNSMETLKITGPRILISCVRRVGGMHD